MAKQLQLRRGTTSQHSSFTGLVGEVTVDTDKDTAVIHDGSTAGGKPLATEANDLLKAPIAGPTFTGTVAIPNIANVETAVAANTAKTGITSGQASAITANTAKTGITSGQASAITANTSKVTNATHTGDVTGGTGLTIADNAITLAKMAGGTDGQVITYDASGDPVAVGPGNDGQVLTSTGAGSPPAFETLSSSDTLSFRNKLMNGDMQVAQRGPLFDSSDGNNQPVDYFIENNDDSYTLDTWYTLSDGNNIIDITQSSEAPANQKYSYAMDVETANGKFGMAQIVENADSRCVGLIGNTVTFSFKAKVSATTKLDNVKAAIISWQGSADSVTSDVVSAWGAEGTNPTLAANLTYENTPANLSVTTSWASYSVSAAIDTSSTTNVIVFIWSDVTDTTVGDFLYITDCQLEEGSSATSYERKTYGDELILCQRYFQVIVGRGWVTGGESYNYAPICRLSFISNGWIAYGFIRFFGTMRNQPTALEYQGGNNDEYVMRHNSNNADVFTDYKMSYAGGRDGGLLYVNSYLSGPSGGSGPTVTNAAARVFVGFSSEM